MDFLKGICKTTWLGAWNMLSLFEMKRARSWRILVWVGKPAVAGGEENPGLIWWSSHQTLQAWPPKSERSWQDISWYALTKIIVAAVPIALWRNSPWSILKYHSHLVAASPWHGSLAQHGRCPHYTSAWKRWRRTPLALGFPQVRCVELNVGCVFLTSPILTCKVQ